MNSVLSSHLSSLGQGCDSDGIQWELPTQERITRHGHGMVGFPRPHIFTSPHKLAPIQHP